MCFEFNNYILILLEIVNVETHEASIAKNVLITALNWPSPLALIELKDGQLIHTNKAPYKCLKERLKNLI